MYGYWGGFPVCKTGQSGCKDALHSCSLVFSDCCVILEESAVKMITHNNATLSSVGQTYSLIKMS